MNSGQLFKHRFTFLLRVILVVALVLPAWVVSAQDEEEEPAPQEASIALSFDQTDTTRICKATVTSGGKPVAEADVQFYVKRMYSLLPIGKAVTTDENGEAIMLFPLDLPGDEKNNLAVVAKIEDHEIFDTVLNEASVKWGVSHKSGHEWGGRSLSAARDKAPMTLIVASNTIIAIIWGTIFYVIYQVYRIRKEGNTKGKTAI
jgi:hypothetical protein